MDIFPTLTDYVLNEKITGIDGQSFKNVLTGKEKWNNRTVYWNSFKARPTQTGDNKTSAIRVGDFKLLHFVETDKIELYNVKEDISERKDLSAQMPDKTKEMLDLLNKWKAERNVKMKANHKSEGENSETLSKKEVKKAERKANKKGEGSNDSDE
jgi:arylsulfatase A-like enzyme